MLNIYKASAGSGKTFTLTKEYLRLLLGRHNPETGKWTLRSKPEQAHRHILAITFTNKATEEMTRRIIAELALLSHRDQWSKKRSPYADEFCRLFEVDETSLAETASEVLDDLLFDFAYFHVSTIDAFFQNVLRIFAREIEMPDNFELELNNAYTISIGVNEMFSSINYRDPIDPIKKKERQWLKQWLERYMDRMLENGESINIFSRTSWLYNKLISNFTRFLDEDFKINSDRIIGYLSNVERIPAFEKALVSRLNALKTKLTQTAIRVTQSGDFPNLNRYVKQSVLTWSTGADKSPTGTIYKAVDEISSRYVAAYAKAGNIPPDFDSAVISACALAIEVENTVKLNRLMTDALGSLGLLGCLLRYIEDYCKDNNMIMLSETNSLLRDIINDDDTPFVYERLGYYLRHFLIDEFQDTSRMQWENLKPLVMESLSHNHDNLVIGDEKQCIYRFRNSDPELLGHQVADAVAEVYGEGSTDTRGTDIDDNNNWRSSHEVVMFNNTLFHAIARYVDKNGAVSPDSPSSATTTFSTVIQQIDSSREKLAGHVKIYFKPDEKPSDENENATDSDESVVNGDEFALSTSVTEIDRLLTAGYKPKDIAILVRTHTEGEKIINRLLSLADDPSWPHGKIDVQSTDSIDIAASPAVKMVIGILRLSLTPEYIEVRHPDDPEGKYTTEVNPAYMRARLLQRYEYFLHCPVNDRNGEKVYLTPPEALSRALDLMRPDSELDAETLRVKKADEEMFRSGTPVGNDVLECPSLPAIVEHVIARYVAPEALERETIFLTAFQDLVYDYCQRGTADIRSFIEWWDHGGCQSGLSSTPDSDAISVMTIHQSKGLEFPCVLMPFGDWALINPSTPTRPNYSWYRLDPCNFPGTNPELVPPMIPLANTLQLTEIPMFSSQARDFFNRQRVDSLNVAYVAMTRAVNELIVVTDRRPSSKERPENLGYFIHKAISEMTPAVIGNDTTLTDKARRWLTPLAEGLKNDVFESGKPTSPRLAAKTSAPQKEVILPDYRPGVNGKLATLSKADLTFFDFDDPRQRGEFLHRVMSKVRHRDRLGVALDRAAYRAHLNPRQTAFCRNVLENALDDDRVARWFDGYSRVLNEYTIVSDGKKRRPDRVVWTGEGTVDIIDYKFGDHDDKYLSQVNRYMRLLRLSGEKNVRGFLWYPLEKRIIEVGAPTSKQQPS